MHLSQIFQHLVVVSLLGSFLALGILIIKTLLGRKLNANWHYAVWLLLIFRLCMPFSVSSSFSVLNLIPYCQQVINIPASLDTGTDDTSAPNLITPGLDGQNSTGEAMLDTGEIQPTPSSAIKSAVNWENASLAWIIGLAMILLYLLTINTMMFFKVKKLPLCADPYVQKVLDGCKTILNIKSEIRVVYDNSLRSPALFGIFKPRIIISPEVIKRLSAEELSCVFLHELSHLKRYDLLINCLLLIIQAVYWFNPIIWYAMRQMKRDCEIACDAAVLNEIEPHDRKQYGHTIIIMLQLLSEPHWAPGTLGYVTRFNKRRIVMISSHKKTSIKWAIVALATLLLVGCSSLNTSNQPADQGANQQIADTADDSVNNNQQDADTSSSDSSNSESSASLVYKNTEYGFDFTLPASWQGYTIITSKWQGTDVQSGKTTETGPIISIRHPQWTSQNPRQDIPIMVLTISQWNQVQAEKLSLGAAPIGPTELGRNSTYVFALPARYNFAFPTGFEEVEKIMAGHPLQAN